VEAMTDTWNPTQYDRFQSEREQPFYDLLTMIRPVPGMRIVDLGCGTGKLTRELHTRLAARETTGIDRSPRMLERASTTPLPTGLRFESATIEQFVPKLSESSAKSDQRYDLIFSNAALHWVDHHEALLQRLAVALPSGGQLAFQVPAQHDTVTHITADEVAQHEPFKTVLGGWRHVQPVLAPEAYSRLLYRFGFTHPNVRLIVYPHILAGPEDVVEWVKGTLLTEYERHLSPEMFGRFVAEYRERLLPRLERLDPGRPCFFPFKRILCWGQRA
jgi:trans-aconitate 2-methyltransferase